MITELFPLLKRLTEPTISITKQDWQAAERDFKPNCGPTALAVICGISVCKACSAIPGFAERHFTNPTMMQAALKSLGAPWHERDDADCDERAIEGKRLTRYGLCRIQWAGPWTAPDANPKWAYRQTHWVAAATFNWPEPEKPVDFVFDVNFGWLTRADWEYIHVPKLIAEVKRATGEWWATHRWELEI